jgi:hypothetical protein
MLVKNVVIGVVVSLVAVGCESPTLEQKRVEPGLQKRLSDHAQVSRSLMTGANFIEAQNSSQTDEQAIAIGYLAGVMDTLSLAVLRYEIAPERFMKDEDLIDKLVISELRAFDACLRSEVSGVRLGMLSRPEVGRPRVEYWRQRVCTPCATDEYRPRGTALV